VEAAPLPSRHVLPFATVYYRLDERKLGDQERAIVEQLRAKEKAEQREGDEGIGPTSFGESPGPPQSK
jgi:hypothetical protein